MVKDVRPGAADSALGGLAALDGGGVYFSADDGVNGPRLWRTDGTDTGTVMVVDPAAGAAAPFAPEGLRASVGKLFFTAFRGSRPLGNLPSPDLWVTDGTVAGTRVLKAEAGSGQRHLFQSAAVGGTLYYLGAATGRSAALWRTDGTPAGTTLVYGGADVA